VEIGFGQAILCYDLLKPGTKRRVKKCYWQSLRVIFKCKFYLTR